MRLWVMRQELQEDMVPFFVFILYLLIQTEGSVLLQAC